jgi:hypothetical protein
MNHPFRILQLYCHHQLPRNIISAGFTAPSAITLRKNSVSAGNTVPVKFSLGGNNGTAIFAESYPASRKVSCSTLTDSNPNNLAVAAVHGGFTYDATKEQYNYIWRTDKSWKGTCREFAVMFNDGTRKTAIFQFK